MDGIVGTRANNLVVFNNRLYAHTGYEVYQSTDEGGDLERTLNRRGICYRRNYGCPLKTEQVSAVHTSFDSKLMVDGNILYFVSPEKHILRIYRFICRWRYAHSSSRRSYGIIMNHYLRCLKKAVKIKAIVVSNNVLYAEYGQRLFKWKLVGSKMGGYRIDKHW